MDFDKKDIEKIIKERQILLAEVLIKMDLDIKATKKLKELIPTLTDDKKREFNGHLNYIKKDLEQLEDERVKLTGEIDDLNSRLEDLTIQKGGKINKKRKTNKRRNKKHTLKKRKTNKRNY